MSGLHSLFIKEFTKELILNSSPAYLRDKKIESKSKELEIKEEIEQILKRPLEIEKEASMYKALEVNKPKIRQIKTSTDYIQPNIRKRRETMEIPYIEESGEFQVGKINSMIKDPNVISIECPGPNKFVIVSTLGKVILSKLMLNADEINFILDNFSREARIPRIEGVFKAIVNNLIITAIDSEFAGPRFIITKIKKTKGTAP